LCHRVMAGGGEVESRVRNQDHANHSPPPICAVCANLHIHIVMDAAGYAIVDAIVAKCVMFWRIMQKKR